MLRTVYINRLLQIMAQELSQGTVVLAKVPGAIAFWPAKVALADKERQGFVYVRLFGSKDSTWVAHKYVKPYTSESSAAGSKRSRGLENAFADAEAYLSTFGAQGAGSSQGTLSSQENTAAAVAASDVDDAPAAKRLHTAPMPARSSLLSNLPSRGCLKLTALKKLTAAPVYTTTASTKAPPHQTIQNDGSYVPHVAFGETLGNATPKGKGKGKAKKVASK
jgi:PWWP domain